jgi:hypothetical protein
MASRVTTYGIRGEADVRTTLAIDPRAMKR